MRMRMRMLLIGLTAATCPALSQTIVDDAGTSRFGKVGYWSSVVARGGDVAISYYCEDDMQNDPPTQFTLRFAWVSGGAWQWTTVDYWAGSDTSMARGTDGQYQIVYASWTGMGWATGSANTWNVSAVDIPAAMAPSNISMVLDSANRPHVAYMNFANGGDRSLRYTYFDGTQWVPGGANSGIVGTGLWTPTIGFSNTHLKLDAAGTPHIAFAQPSDAINAYGPIQYATLVGGSNGTWQTEALGVSGVDPSLAIGTDGVPRIAFNGDAGLTYAYRSGGAWQYETVAPGEWGSSVSMALSDTDVPVLSFGLGANEDMYLARREPGGWVMTRIDGDGTSDPHVILGRYGTSVAVDETGQTHASYLAIDIYGLTHRCDLKYFGPGGGPPPCVRITQSPAPAQPCPAGSASFSVAASGTGILGYQWRFNGQALVDGVTPGGSIISGATSAALWIDGVTDSDQGSYDCVVTADCGSATSAAAALTIAQPAAIFTGPAPASACIGASASFSVTATGTSPAFTWYHGSAPLSDGPTGNGSVISGASGPTLVISGVTAADGGEYSCAVINACGGDVSPAATLTVSTCGGCVGDVDEDLDVDLADLAQLLAHFGDDGASHDDGDLDGDGDVDLSDLAALLSNFGTEC
ncbi:MAG: hypothetical protein AMXMBFR47_39720 [Planctomycetota bacterium]